MHTKLSIYQRVVWLCKNRDLSDAKTLTFGHLIETNCASTFGFIGRVHKVTTSHLYGESDIVEVVFDTDHGAHALNLLADWLRPMGLITLEEFVGV